MKLHRYGMRLRPFDIGCQPKKGFVKADESDKRFWNVIYYSRYLTDEEMFVYSLTDLGEVEDGEEEKTC